MKHSTIADDPSHRPAVVRGLVVAISWTLGALGLAILALYLRGVERWHDDQARAMSTEVAPRGDQTREDARSSETGTRLALGSGLLATEALGQGEAPVNGLALGVKGGPGALADATLVVFNDTDRDSRDLARFYAEKRGIPKQNLVPLRCAIGEEITRDEYDRTIAEPIRRAMSANGLWKLRETGNPLGPVEWNKIRFVALMRGIPLKIQPAQNYPGDRQVGPPALASHNEAAVDSELSVLGVNFPIISGAINNPYFRSYARITDSKLPELMLVCRLDGPTPGIVRRMITDSIEAEAEGLNGFCYVDARGIAGSDGYGEGDTWLVKLADDARKRGSPVILDNGPELFPMGYPMRDAALYFGWYSGDVAGALAVPGFKFPKGAVAVHIHSFSGASVRSAAQFWVGPLLFAGAACTLGNVYEPYLTLTPNLDVFHERLRAGFTFAESAYMSQKFLSWQTTFVGDPLYSPFKDDGGIVERAPRNEWEAYSAGARLWFRKGRAAGEASLRASAKKFNSGLIYEGLGLLEIVARDPNAAIGAFQQSRERYKNPEDICRVAIHEAFQLRATKREPDALALIRKTVATYPRAGGASVLQMLDVKPATPAPAVAIPAPPPR